MTIEKVNDSGVIPNLKVIVYEGKRVYFRDTFFKDIMRMFWGIGISHTILDNLEDLDYIIRHHNEKGIIEGYRTSIKQFRDSKKIRKNTEDDVQSFVSLRDMERIK